MFKSSRVRGASLFPVTIAAEGDTDFPVARAIIKLAGLAPGKEIDCGGKGKLDERLPGYSAAANGAPWLVLRDLDHDAPCAGELIPRLINAPGRFLCLRVAVRASEAWLLADAERFADFMRISRSRITLEPDKLADPKLEIVNLARGSRKPVIVSDMVPKQGASRKIGPGYEARIIEFADERWRPDIARTRSPSLDRCIRALERLERLLRERAGDGSALSARAARGSPRRR